MVKYIVVILGVLSLSSTCFGEVSIGDYKMHMKSANGQRQLELYTDGFAAGVSLVNAVVEARGGQGSIFCSKSDVFIIHGQDFRNIIDDFIITKPSNFWKLYMEVQKRKFDDIIIENVFLITLEEKFSC